LTNDFLKKDLNKQKESNKKLESGITNREKKISHLQNSNLQLEKENLDLKARHPKLTNDFTLKYPKLNNGFTLKYPNGQKIKFTTYIDVR
jgi:predicted RNase H-like nuclease (RuvC/YqgF family)